MYTPKTFSQAQEVIGNYKEKVEAQDRTIDLLQRACAAHIAHALLYRVWELPRSLEHTCVVFTGSALEWTTIPIGNEGAYDRYIYEPLESLHVEMATLPRTDCGEAMPIVYWRGVLWGPTVHYKGTMWNDHEDLVEEGKLAPARPVQSSNGVCPRT